MNLKEYLSEKREIIDSALDHYLPPADRYPEVLHEAMRYSVMNGGKRLRPVLAIAACEAVGGDYRLALPTGCAIELIHAFSLIHDDLPALDNDDLRRGNPTNHKVYGEAMAILAGDGLLAYAFETIAKFTKGVPAGTIVDVIGRVAAATGMSGMIVGQVVDIISEGQKIEPETLKFMHRNKTGALITLSCVTGALLGGGTDEQIDSLRLYGEKIGLAFQIADDILDVVGDQEKLGKPVGSDVENNKSTYPSLYGLEKSREFAEQAVQDAVNVLKGFDDKAEPLRTIARYIVIRDS
ncbi:MAG TPA: farnesyl diphosphate synthase [Armatimonadota bacterium]